MVVSTAGMVPLSEKTRRAPRPRKATWGRQKVEAKIQCSLRNTCPDGDRSPRLTPSRTLGRRRVAALSTWLVRWSTHKDQNKKKSWVPPAEDCVAANIRAHWAPRATATPRVTPAPTLQVTGQAANFGAAETARRRPSAEATACCALIVADASLRTWPTTPRRVRRAIPGAGPHRRS
ncbi:hypothetical protein NN561_003253 [Cricetulus griseus]